MTKPTVTEQMVEAAFNKYLVSYTRPNIPAPREAMRAAIEAALNASGLVEENARLRAEINTQRIAIEMLKEAISDAGLKIEFVPRHPQALNKEPTP